MMNFFQASSSQARSARRERLAWVLMLLLHALSARGGDDARARAEVQRIAEQVPAFAVKTLSPAAGRHVLDCADGMTAADLRGIPLDPDPPEMGRRPEGYRKLVEGLETEENPVYEAKGVLPFRFREFDCEFHYDSAKPHPTYPINEYAATHGFNLMSLYRRDPDCWTHLPAGTEWVRVQGFRWDDWFRERGLEPDRWDLWMQARERGETMIPPGRLSPDPRFARHIVDLEFGGLLPREELLKQPWYPVDGDDAERAAFERRYYEGYALSYSEPGRAARRDGWPLVSVYAWDPLRESWDGLDKRIRLDTAQPWGRRFIDGVFAAYDIVHVYGYPNAWSPRYVADSLLSMDLALDCSRRQPRPKPVWIYFSNTIVGQPDVGRWLRTQPMPSEDVRAACAMLFFQGADGFVFWNYAFGGDPRCPPDLDAPPAAGARVVQVGREFEVANAHRKTMLRRYDHLRLLSWDAASRNVTFDRIDPSADLASQPPVEDGIFKMDRDALRRHLRPAAEAIAPMVEGLALAKAFEYTLRHGEVKIDQDMRRVWEEVLPICRRVKFGDLHLVATYDPRVVAGHSPRRIELDDFDGRAGLTLSLPADDQVRIFALHLPLAQPPPPPVQ